MRLMLPKLVLNIERWKWNEEYQVYVSTKGHVRDAKKQPVKLRLNQGGYMMAKTKKDMKPVHRLVMETWKPVQQVLTVDHLNSNKRDNRLKNLEWCTKAENQRRAAEVQILFPNTSKPKKANLYCGIALTNPNELDAVDEEKLVEAFQQGSLYLTNKEGGVVTYSDLLAKIQKQHRLEDTKKLMHRCIRKAYFGSSYIGDKYKIHQAGAPV